MPSPITEPLNLVVESFGSLDHRLLTAQMIAHEVRKDLEVQNKIFKGFMASCDEGFSTRLRNIAGVKPDKRGDECTAILKIVSKYGDLCRSAREALPKGMSTGEPVADLQLNEFAVALRKIGELLEDLKKQPGDKDLADRIASAGKIWSAWKSSKPKLVSATLAQSAKDIGVADDLVKLFAKIKPHFGRDVLGKFEQLDRAAASTHKAGAARLLPVAELLQKKAQEILKALEDKKESVGRELARDLLIGTKKLRSALASMAEG